MTIKAILMQFRIVLLLDRWNRGFEFHSAYGCIRVFLHMYVRMTCVGTGLRWAYLH